jgi:Glycosyltransferase
MKINVLFVMGQMGMGGSERLIHNLVKNMDRGAYNASIAWFYLEKVLPEFKELGVPLYHVPKEKRIDFATMKKLAELIRDRDIHVVNAHHFLPFVYSFYGAKIKNQAKLVYTEHSEAEIRSIPWKWRALGKYMLGRTDCLVGINEKITEALLKTFVLTNTTHKTIRNGVDLDAFREIREKDSLKRELGLRNTEILIGIVANFRKNKNHLFLLKAFKELLRFHGNIKLYLVGQGFDHDPDNSEGEIRRYISTNGMEGKVILAGYRPDVSTLLGAMDIFCLTSYKEGLPIAMIEAMASSLPIVGTDAEGIRDVIRHRENGFLVEIDNVEALTTALGSLIDDDNLRRNMGRRSRDLATENYSLQECLGQYQTLFKSLSVRETNS